MGNRDKAVALLEEMRGRGISDKDLLEHIVYNYMSGAESVDALEDAREDFIGINEDAE